jgi:hypothetical protein
MRNREFLGGSICTTRSRITDSAEHDAVIDIGQTEVRHDATLGNTASANDPKSERFHR